MKPIKKAFCLFLTAVLTTCLFAVHSLPVFADSLPASGQCGEHATWTLAADGTLTIDGEGWDLQGHESGWEQYKKDIRSIVITGNITSIDDYAFTDCTELTSVTFNDKLEKIGTHAFEGCTKLTSITFNENLKNITIEAFKNCTGLTSVTFNENLEKIGSGVFSGCTGLTDVAFGDKLQSIGKLTFQGCTGLKTITFSGNQPEISNTPFKGVTATVYYPAGNDSWKNAVKDSEVFGGELTWVETEVPEKDDEAASEENINKIDTADPGMDAKPNLLIPVLAASGAVVVIAGTVSGIVLVGKHRKS